MSALKPQKEKYKPVKGTNKEKFNKGDSKGENYNNNQHRKKSMCNRSV